MSLYFISSWAWKKLHVMLFREVAWCCLICSEVRVEGLETLDYLDHLAHRERFTEQADAITFDGEVPLFSFVLILKAAYLWIGGNSISYVFLFSQFFVPLQVNRVYLNTPTKIAMIDHEKKRTFVLRKDGMPDAGSYDLWFCYKLLLFCFVEKIVSHVYAGKSCDLQLSGTLGTKRPRLSLIWGLRTTKPCYV